MAWLRFHGHAVLPYRWQWLDSKRRQPRGGPETWVILKAWRRDWSEPGTTPRIRTVSIRQDERGALRPYFYALALTDAGRALLAALDTPPSPQPTREAGGPRATPGRKIPTGETSNG